MCLLEHRLEYPLSRFGLLEAFVPAHRIEVLTGAVTLSSILLSGLHFMRVYGLPNQSETRLLGKEDHYTWKSEGVAAGFCDISHLTPTEQNCKLELYNNTIKPVVKKFLAHFTGHLTFHLRPETVVAQGAPTTVLHRHLKSLGYKIKWCDKRGYKIPEAMIALSFREVLRIAESAMSNFEEVKGSPELRVSIMKAVGIHPKDVAAAIVYLETAKDPIPCPTTKDLEDWIGWDPDVRESLRELKEDSLQDRIIIERMGVSIAALMKMVRSLTDAEALRTKSDSPPQEAEGAEINNAADDQDQPKWDV